MDRIRFKRYAALEKERGPDPRACERLTEAEELRRLTRSVMAVLDRNGYDPKRYSFDTSNGWVRGFASRGLAPAKFLLPTIEADGDHIYSWEWPDDDMAMEQTIHFVPDDDRKHPVEGLVCKNWLILPTVASGQRQKDLAQMLAYATHTDEVGPMRMLVATTGKPCHADEIPFRDAWLKKRIQILRRRLWFSSVAELCWSVLETPCSADADSEPLRRKLLLPGIRKDAAGFLYHPHRHITYRLLRPLSEPEWLRFLSRLRTHFKGRWIKESGKIKSLEHACKYTLKLGDLRALLADEHEFIRLHEALTRIRRLESYDSFRKFRGYLRRSGDHVRRVYTQVDGHQVATWSLIAPMPRKKQREETFEGMKVNLFVGRTVRSTRQGNRRIHNILINAVDEPAYVLEEIYELPRWNYSLTPEDLITEIVRIPARRLFGPLSSTYAPLFGVCWRIARYLFPPLRSTLLVNVILLGTIQGITINRLLPLMHGH